MRREKQTCDCMFRGWVPVTKNYIYILQISFPNYIAVRYITAAWIVFAGDVFWEWRKCYIFVPQREQSTGHQRPASGWSNKSTLGNIRKSLWLPIKYTGHCCSMISPLIITMCCHCLNVTRNKFEIYCCSRKTNKICCLQTFYCYPSSIRSCLITLKPHYVSFLL